MSVPPAATPDVAPEKFVAAARENHANVIGVSALLTTTMTNMKSVVEAVKASDLAGKVKELKQDGDVYSGELTEEGAKSQLMFGGRGGANAPEISGAKGSVKFWIKDGLLSKYEIKVQGKVTINGNDRDVDRTTTVEIKEIGSTKVQVPEDAKKKLS